MAYDMNRASPAEAPSASAGSIGGRALTIAAMDRLVTRIAESAEPADSRVGTEYLLFSFGQVPCAAPLTALREVLPTLPIPVPLPFSPPWFLGVFPLRLDMIGLVDLAPRLLGSYSPPAHLPSTATAIVAGDETLLALAVDAVGDIALVQPQDLRDDWGSQSPPIAVTYARGLCSPSTGGIYTVIDVPRLVADLVRELMEVAARE
jgi:chemotaxis signal transduction protein